MVGVLGVQAFRMGVSGVRPVGLLALELSVRELQLQLLAVPISGAKSLGQEQAANPNPGSILTRIFEGSRAEPNTPISSLRRL